MRPGPFPHEAMNKNRFLPTLLVVALIGTIIELDMSVPSFPDIARALDASESIGPA
ncbi:hypothetical protein SGLAM104S_05303 [Streptomyces glaucescens]